MSLGNVSSFLDIYMEYELAKGTIANLSHRADRPVCHQTAYGTPPAYAIIQRHLCRRPDMGNRIYRRTLQRRTYQSDKDLFPLPANIVQPRPSPEPNLTVLWSPELPEGFKEFCAKYLSTLLPSSTKTTTWCVRYASPTTTESPAAYLTRKSVNKSSSSAHVATWPKPCCLPSTADVARKHRYGNGEKHPRTDQRHVLNFEEVMDNYKKCWQKSPAFTTKRWTSSTICTTSIYEKAQMALADTNPRINLAYGVAGLSIALDSLSPSNTQSNCTPQRHRSDRRFRYRRRIPLASVTMTTR